MWLNRLIDSCGKLGIIHTSDYPNCFYVGDFFYGPDLEPFPCYGSTHLYHRTLEEAEREFRAQAANRLV